jgi:hypothetical protein
MLVIASAACSSDNGSHPSSSPDPPPVSIQNGAMVATSNCARCHDPGDHSYSGRTTSVVAGAMVFPPNLTPDKDSGIGSWTDDQIKMAMRGGVVPMSRQLCSIMPRWTDLTDDQVNSVVLFLRSLPPISKQIPDTVCVSADPLGL